MLTIAILWRLWSEEIGFAICAGVVILVGLIAAYSQMKSALVGFVGLMVIVALSAAVLPNFIGVTDCYNPATLSKHNLQVVKLALERFAFDNDGFYPGDIEVLRKELYLPTFPENRYFYLSNRAELRKLDYQEAEKAAQTKNIYQFANLELSSLPGNFAYLPIFNIDDDDKSLAIGYKLFWFAKTRTDKQEYITTILVLENDPLKEEIHPSQ